MIQEDTHSQTRLFTAQIPLLDGTGMSTLFCPSAHGPLPWAWGAGLSHLPPLSNSLKENSGAWRMDGQCSYRPEEPSYT